MMTRKETYNAITVAIIVIAVAALANRDLVWQQVKGLLARRWLTCQGTVEFGSVEKRRSRYKNFYIGRIDYSYSVNGEHYSGCYVKIFTREAAANRLVDGMKKQAVFVRYKPGSPDRSALLKDDQPGGWPS